MSSILGNALAGILFVGWAVIGLRGCTTSVWMPDDTEISAYEIVGGDGRVLHVAVMPDNYVALAYVDPGTNENELIVARWRGTPGERYPFGLWNFPNAPMPGLNWRRFDEGLEPVFMEMERLETFGNVPIEQSSFPSGTAHSVVAFAEDGTRLFFEGMALRDVQPDPVVAEILASRSSIPRVREIALSSWR